MIANPAARLLEALDAAGTAGLDRHQVMALLDCTADEARDLVTRAIGACRAYRPPNGLRIYSTAPFA